MKRAMIPLLLIALMALSVAVAVAQNFSDSGPFTEPNGWAISENWNGNSPPDGTDTATATHPVVTGPSGAFTCDVSLTINDLSNVVEASLVANTGAEIRLEYTNYYYSINGVYVGDSLSTPPGTVTASFSSTDGINWHVAIAGNAQDIAVNGVPTTVSVAAQTGGVGVTPPVVNSVNFVSDDTPAPTPTASPTVTPTPAPQPEPNAGPSDAQLQQIRDFYANIYPELSHNPNDIVTYENGHWVYTPVNTAAATPTPAPLYAISGAVTAAADGKPISGASVVIGSSLQKTNEAGQFKVGDLAAGSYNVAVSADGFAAQTKTVSVSDNTALNFALDKVATGGASGASAANETKPINATATLKPTATQTKSPGFEGLLAVLSIVALAGALIYVRRKR